MEELILKYIRRKPTSTGELLQKVIKLKPGLDKDRLCKLVVATLIRLGVISKKDKNGKILWSMQ